jgi:hypothetical protein
VSRYVVLGHMIDWKARRLLSVELARADSIEAAHQAIGKDNNDMGGCSAWTLYDVEAARVIWSGVRNIHFVKGI